MAIKAKIKKLQKKIRCKHCGSNKKEVYFAEQEPCRILPSCRKCLIPELGNRFVRFLIDHVVIYSSCKLDVNRHEDMILINTLYETGEINYKRSVGFYDKKLCDT